MAEGSVSGKRQPPLVAVLIVNWRLASETLVCLDDLRRCGHERLCTLVLDNGSGDGSAERLRAAVGDGVELEVLSENVGYCKAINLGLAWAERRGAELVLLLNNDMRLSPGFLSPLVSVLVNDAQAVCVGPTMLREDGRVWCQGGRLAFAPNLARLRDQGRQPAPTSEGPVAVEFMPGACALYRRSALAAVGGLDESYFIYWEDVDLGARLRARGGKVLWIPWTRVTHASGASSGGGGRTPLRKYACAVNAVRYLRRHPSLRLGLAFLLFDLLGWPLGLCTGASLRATLAKGRGVWAGLLGKRVGPADVSRLCP